MARGRGRGHPLREIARSIGDHLGLPAESIPDSRLQEHFGFLADFDHGDYFTTS